jgi:RHS repeat-associated protein
MKLLASNKFEQKKCFCSMEKHRQTSKFKAQVLLELPKGTFPDEQNRLLGVKDEGQRLSYYLYDANGDRTYKFTGEYAAQNRSGQWHYYYLLDRLTLYASHYLVSNEKGYTKHYYAESERIASWIGGGGLHDLHNGYGDYPDMVIRHQESANSLFGNVLECLGADAMHEEDALGYLYDWQELVEEEKECYWYHPDHLGSSSWITYTDGSAVQHLHYLPFGEEFVDQRTTDFSARFTFSAKEKDSETGLSYFGSRYYSSDLSVWLSVDPMSDKYASLSPYVYCANNPVMLVDPDGEAIDPASQDEWNNNKQQITSTIVNRLFRLVTNTQEDRSYTNKSILSLCNTLNVMNQMEQDPVWTFALSSIGGKTTGYTKLTRDPDHNMAYLFQIGYSDMANFVHEITHCGQFLNGKIGFLETENGFGAYVDVYDELEAYQSQYYYSQGSLPLNNQHILTVAWLYNVKDDNGDYPYRKDGRISYDGFATECIMKAAYPKIAKEFDNMHGYLFHQERAVFNIVFK